MEYRVLPGAGLRVPVLSLGTGAFGAEGIFEVGFGKTDVSAAKRMVSICLEAGANFFDAADAHSNGKGEEVLGAAIAGRRHDVLIGTKGSFPCGSGPNDGGSSRLHILKACEDSLRRLGTDYIDIYYMHFFDATTPVEETLSALDTLVRSGKVRYIGCSNFSGWHLMKCLAVADRYGWPRHVVHQALYSLATREFEWELMPLGLDQKVGTVVYSALSGAALTGKLRRGQPSPPASRLSQLDMLASSRSARLYDIIDALDEIAQARGKSIAQVALNWVLQRPSVVNVVMGARNEEQLKDNLGAVGWSLTPEEMTKLDNASDIRPIYPYFHHRAVATYDPPPVPVPPMTF